MNRSTKKPQFVTRQDIISKAREVVHLHGGQVKVADTLKVKQPSVSKALRDGDTSMDELRNKILGLAGLAVREEIFFILEELPATKRRAKK